MSKNCKEQRPLLFDNLSDEENFGEQKPLYRGRAKFAASGAATIITRWPEHWSSVLCHWWLGLSMFAITVFIIYNSISAFALLPPSYMKSQRPRVNKVQLAYEANAPNLYMHLLVNSTDDVDLANYIPYIDIISKNYTNFKYNLIVVLNDNTNEQNEISEEENNEVALNSLWTKERTNGRNINGINVEYITLSKYMSASPLKKNWRFLPSHFIKFLVRALSIWERGGIAIDPKILTPDTQNTIYNEKLQNILENYGKQTKMDSKPNVDALYNLFGKHEDKNQKKVYNIRDIIENIEMDNTLSSSQESLAEAESKYDITKSSGRKLLTVLEEHTPVEPFDITLSRDKKSKHHGNKKKDTFDEDVLTDFESDETKNVYEDNIYLEKEDKSFLPRFLDFLFNDKSRINKLPQANIKDTRPRKSIESQNSNNFSEVKSNVSDSRQLKSIDSQKVLANYTISSTNTPKVKNVVKWKPIIISAKSIPVNDGSTINQSTENKTRYEKDHLTLDLNGNILATEAPCHAFLGTVFSNAINYTDEQTLRDFIIAELSFFCKGLLSSCRGIDVILL